MKEPSAGQTPELQLAIETALMLKPEERVFVLFAGVSTAVAAGAAVLRVAA